MENFHLHQVQHYIHRLRKIKISRLPCRRLMDPTKPECGSLWVTPLLPSMIKIDLLCISRFMLGRERSSSGQGEVSLLRGSSQVRADLASPHAGPGGAHHRLHWRHGPQGSRGVQAEDGGVRGGCGPGESGGALLRDNIAAGQDPGSGPPPHHQGRGHRHHCGRGRLHHDSWHPQAS